MTWTFTSRPVTVTVARNSVWASDIRLWQDAEKNAYGLVRPHLNLGAAFQVAGEFDQALVEYRVRFAGTKVMAALRTARIAHAHYFTTP